MKYRETDDKFSKKKFSQFKQTKKVISLGSSSSRVMINSTEYPLLTFEVELMVENNKQQYYNYSFDHFHHSL